MTVERNTIHIDTVDGPLIGLKESDLVYARGIPYAVAQRFEVPQPTCWSQVINCTHPAPICPQNKAPLEQIFGDLTRSRNQSEDCLTVTVAAPLGASDLPVMVYFHGGAYMILGGDLDSQNTKGLARKGVVTVNVTYRLGLLGYVPIPGVSPANLGLLDQIEALKWVQRNISAFGGDPNRVTIFGQSAGGDSVVSILAANGTEGLFSRVIIQSSPMGILYQEDYGAAVEAMGHHAKTRLTNTTPLSEILRIQQDLAPVAAKTSPGLKLFGPVYGQHPLPPWSAFEDQIKLKTKGVDVLIGYTRDEGIPFSLMDPGHDADWYTTNVFEKPTALFMQILTDAKSVAQYRFDWSPDGSALGACHCIELPMLLGDFAEWQDTPMMQGKNAREGVESIGPQMKTLWVDLAHGVDMDGMHFLIDGQFRYPSSRVAT